MAKSNFNRSRSLFDCKPDCPERKPGCQDHCERYAERKALNEARKLEVYGDPGLRQYLKSKQEERRDMTAKDKKRHGQYRRTRFN